VTEVHDSERNQQYNQEDLKKYFLYVHQSKKIKRDDDDNDIDGSDIIYDITASDRE